MNAISFLSDASLGKKSIMNDSCHFGKGCPYFGIGVRKKRLRMRGLIKGSVEVMFLSNDGKKFTVFMDNVLMIKITFLRHRFDSRCLIIGMN